VLLLLHCVGKQIKRKNNDAKTEVKWLQKQGEDK